MLMLVSMPLFLIVAVFVPMRMTVVTTAMMVMLLLMLHVLMFVLTLKMQNIREPQFLVLRIIA